MVAAVVLLTLLTPLTPLTLLLTLESSRSFVASSIPTSHRCRCPKSKSTGSEAGRIVNGRHNPWREVLDAASKQLYYHNIETNETKWERPAEMGQAPLATGWFGRGAAGSDAAARYEAENIEYIARPARKQAEHKAGVTSVLEGAYEYNIWYNKYIGDHWSGKRGKDPAESRCNVARDAGFTKADKNMNSGKYFCLFFARGCCAYGHSCHFAHRIPVKDDIGLLQKDDLHDCFGRTRHKDHRDDMDGVGSVMKPCRTLYVGNLAKAKYANPQELEKTLWTSFGEWGEVENINVIARLSIAFVRYRFRTSAEFAKEAMGNQALAHGEILNVRWAMDDPNPVALEAAHRADADAVINMMSAGGVDLVGAQVNALLPDATTAMNAAASSSAASSDVGEASSSSSSASSAEAEAVTTEAERQAAWAAYYAYLANAEQAQLQQGEQQNPPPSQPASLRDNAGSTEANEPTAKRARRSEDDEEEEGGGEDKG